MTYHTALYDAVLCDAKVSYALLHCTMLIIGYTMACYATFKLYLLHEQLDFGQAALHAAGLPNFLKKYGPRLCVLSPLLSQPADVSANSEREGSKLGI